MFVLELELVGVGAEGGGWRDHTAAAGRGPGRGRQQQQQAQRRRPVSLSSTAAQRGGDDGHGTLPVAGATGRVAVVWLVRARSVLCRRRGAAVGGDGGDGGRSPGRGWLVCALDLFSSAPFSKAFQGQASAPNTRVFLDANRPPRKASQPGDDRCFPLPWWTYLFCSSAALLRSLPRPLLLPPLVLCPPTPLRKMFHDLHVPWSGATPGLQQTIAFLDECELPSNPWAS